MILLLNSPPKFTETIFLDTVVYKGTRLNVKVILDHVKTTETFQHTFCDLSPTNLSKEFEESVSKFKKTAWWLMMDRGYQHNLKDKSQSEINETHRNRSPCSWNKTEQGRKRNIPFSDTIGNFKNHDEVHDDDVCWQGKDWNENVSFGRKKET